MALERIPSDIRKDGGIARMSDPEMIKEIQKSVSSPLWLNVELVILQRLKFLRP